LLSSGCHWQNMAANCVASLHHICVSINVE
jgi:hypothetical protein